MDNLFRILIIAADPLARAGLSALLEGFENYQIIGLANPAELQPDLATSLGEFEVDVIVWDWGMDFRESSDIDFHEIDIPVLILLSNPYQAKEALASGAVALLTRDSSPEDILTASKSAQRGYYVIDPQVASQIMPSHSSQRENIDEMPTVREQQVLQLLAEGLTNRAIAQQLQISQHTVKFHVNSLLQKLDAQSRTEAVVQATRLGLIAL